MTTLEQKLAGALFNLRHFRNAESEQIADEVLALYERVRGEGINQGAQNESV